MSRTFDQSYIGAVTDLLTRGFYTMAFQPIIKVDTGQPFGFEALLRGPKGTPLEDPDRFFNRKDNETSSFLSHVDMACIWSAVRSGAVLPDNVKLFINIHGNTVPQLSERKGAFFDLLNEHNIVPGRIVLEVSERTDHKNVQGISQMLYELCETGISVALDDVGIGSPWLYHMLWLEPKYLKLDRAFISGINDNGKKRDIVQGVSRMLSKVDAVLIAEGIENELEFNSIAELGIPLGQGFLTGRPGPAEDWAQRITEGGGTLYQPPGEEKAIA